jgi:hypothetical protein
MTTPKELLDGWVGEVVSVEHLIGPDPTDEQVNAMAENPAENAFDRVPFSRIGFYRLVGCDQFGIIIRTLEEDSIQNFVAWGAVIRIHGPD